MNDFSELGGLIISGFVEVYKVIIIFSFLIIDLIVELFGGLKNILVYFEILEGFVIMFSI